MVNLNEQWITLECPNCNYIDDIQIIDVKIEKIHYCNNCKVEIKLQDNEGSVHNGIESINKAFKDIENLLKKFGK